MKKLNPVETTAERLGVGRTIVFRLIATGELRSVKIGKRRLVSDDAIDEYISKLDSSTSDTGAA